MIKQNQKTIASILLMVFTLATTMFVFKDNIAEAATHVWQCAKCGKQVSVGGNGHPTSSLGCGGDYNKRHVWRMIR